MCLTSTVNLPDGVFSDAHDLLLALDRGQVTAREALEACLHTIETRNPTVNAVIHMDVEGARRAADDRDRSKARTGRLHGIPVTIKECFDWAGHPTTWGDPARKDTVARRDSDVVVRLKGEGAIIIGKTNIPPYLSDWETDNPLFGATCNPRDRRRSAGGSSGGSAAAVASGFSYIDIGSDQGGSVRLPAHYCGVHGLKPSWRTISLRGHSPLGDLRQPDIGVAGPITRSARDAALAFRVLSGRPEDTLDKPLKHCRIAVMPNHPDCPISRSYQEAIDRFLNRLRGMDVTIKTAAPTFDFARATEVMNLLVRAETAPKVPLIEDFKKRHGVVAPGRNDFSRLNAYGAGLSHLEWLALHEERMRYSQIFEEFFEGFDLFLCPAAFTEAAPLRPGLNVTDRTVPVDGREEPVLKQHMLYMFASLCYLPSHVLPIAELDTGLPVGVQLVGARGRDLSVLRIAQQIGRLVSDTEVTRA